MPRVASLIMERDGALAFWRGNVLNCLGAMPAKGLKFFIYELAKKTIAKVRLIQPSPPTMATETLAQPLQSHQLIGCPLLLQPLLHLMPEAPCCGLVFVRIPAPLFWGLTHPGPSSLAGQGGPDVHGAFGGRIYRRHGPASTFPPSPQIAQVWREEPESTAKWDFCCRFDARRRLADAKTPLLQRPGPHRLGARAVRVPEPALNGRTIA